MDLLKIFLRQKAVSTDTRAIAAGSIFFALKGENFNGNAFAKQAIEAGAALAVVDEDIEGLDAEKAIKVDNVLIALQDLARAYRKSFTGTVVGLTGSNGKTTCKELFRDVLSTQYKTHATTGNLNNHIGVPLTLLATPDDAKMVIVEMGANHQKEIELLSSICLPEIGYITNFGKAHLEGFGGVEGVIKGKSELYDNIRSRGKKVMVNCADAKQLEKSEGIDRITFGDCTNANIQINDLKREMAAAAYDGLEIQSLLTGDFHFTNIAASIALGELMEVDKVNIKRAIENYQPKMNRSEWRKTKQNEVLLDAYNANPDSMHAVIKTFAQLQKPNKWYVLGDMFELGEYALQEHQEVVNTLKNCDAKNVVLVGINFKNTISPSGYHKFSSTQEAIVFFKNQKIVDSTVLLKGSRGMKLESLIESL